MRKLKIIEHISLDGVVQMTTNGPEDDFPYGDWTAPFRSPAGLQVVTEMYGKACDLLLGRRTYDSFANYWPKAPRSPFRYRLSCGWSALSRRHSRPCLSDSLCGSSSL